MVGSRALDSGTASTRMPAMTSVERRAIGLLAGCAGADVAACTVRDVSCTVSAGTARICRAAASRADTPTVEGEFDVAVCMGSSGGGASSAAFLRRSRRALICGVTAAASSHAVDRRPRPTSIAEGSTGDSRSTESGRICRAFGTFAGGFLKDDVRTRAPGEGSRRPLPLLRRCVDHSPVTVWFYFDDAMPIPSVRIGNLLLSSLVCRLSRAAHHNHARWCHAYL